MWEVAKDIFRTCPQSSPLQKFATAALAHSAICGRAEDSGVRFATDVDSHLKRAEDS